MDNSKRMHPKVQGDRKALVAPAGAKSLCKIEETA